jgi:voltage-gated potassium channel
MGLIVANVIAIMLETVDWFFESYELYLWYFEFISVMIFTVEYGLRVWVSVEDPEFAGAVSGRLKYIGTHWAVIDLLAFLPFYLPFLGLDLRFLRILRLLRIFRIIRVGRYSEAADILGVVVRKRKEEIAVTMLLFSILLVISSSLMYYAEHEAQPNVFSSIPESMWWGVITLTTIGYGDVVPITPMGKLIGGIIAILGIGMYALPTSILGAGFVEELRKRKGKKKCPHCGKNIDI